jgi:hypothetical protein
VTPGRDFLNHYLRQCHLLKWARLAFSSKMKACLQCNEENENGARFCWSCGHFAYAPALTTPPTEPAAPNATSGAEFLTTESEGKLTVLNCRTPGEAYLVAQELEAADILVTLPDDEVLLKEFASNGFVSIRVSARSYEAAKELQNVHLTSFFT